MLMPAAVLVMMVLGAIAVDSARLLLAQRELADAAAAAANDAAAASLSDAAFYRSGGRLEIDAAHAARTVDAAVQARAPQGLTVDRPAVTVIGRQVCVELRATVEPLFARVVPGAGGPRTVQARATATAVGGAEGVTVPIRGLC
jgi:Flp pilus assembly protein TadG